MELLEWWLGHVSPAQQPHRGEFLSSPKLPSILVGCIDLWFPLVTGQTWGSPNHLSLKAAEAGTQEEGGM